MGISYRHGRALGATFMLIASSFAASACHGQPASQRQSAAAPPPTRSSAPPAAASPNTSDGRPIMQLGLTGIDYYDVADPFIDVLKPNKAELQASLPDRNATDAEVTAEGVIDPDTLLPTKMGRFSRYTLGVFAFGALYYPSEYAGSWVVDWVGKADLQIVWCEHRVTRRDAQRIEFEITQSNKNYCGLFATGVDQTFKRVRVYRKSEEQRLNDGQVFTQRFLNFVKRYKVIRTMDWQQTNGNPIRTTAQLKTADAARYASASPDWAGRPYKAFGMPLRILTRLAREADVALWMTAPNYLGAPADLDTVMRQAAQWDVRALNFRALGKSNARQIIASSEWDRYADAVVSALIDERYPTDRMLYLELGNEIWNTGGGFADSTNYYWGLGDGLFPGTDSAFRDGYGYASARMAEALDGALSRAGRTQAYTIVIAGQNVNTWTTERALARYKAYFTEKGRDSAPWLARVGVSTASYFYNAVTPQGPVQAAAGQSPAAAFLAEIRRDRAGLMKRVVDWSINGGADGKADGSIPSVVAYRRQHQAIAERYGARFIGDYEGESHETGFSELNNTAEYVSFMKELRYGSEGERWTKAWVEALRAQNSNAMIANFVGVSEGNSPNSKLLTPWQDCYYTEVCGRDRALNPYLRPQQ